MYAHRRLESCLIEVSMCGVSTYLMRSRKASAGLTCSTFCVLENSSFVPLPGRIASTMMIPMITAMIVVVV